jgi:hypothetical protein
MEISRSIRVTAVGKLKKNYVWGGTVGSLSGVHSEVLTCGVGDL